MPWFPRRDDKVVDTFSATRFPMEYQPMPRIERLKSVMERTGLSRSSIYAAISRHEFPAQVRLSARAIGFISTEVDDWITSRSSAR